MDDADAMQKEVDSAWNELLTAMSQLRLKPSKELLEALIQTAEGMDLTGVDKEVADTFNIALEEAKNVYADSEADEEEVSLAVTNLQNAIDAVEEDLANQGGNDNPGGNGDQGGDTENPDNPDNPGGQDDTNTPGGQDDQNTPGGQDDTNVPGDQDDTNTPGSQDENNQNGNGTDPSGSSDNSADQTVNQQKAVQTGDSSPILLWTAILTASAAAIVIFEKKRRKQL